MSGVDSDTAQSARRLNTSYELSDQTVDQLTKLLLENRAEELPDSEGRVVIRVSGTEPYANIGRNIERAVFDESFENDPAVMEREYGPYEQASQFLLLIDQNDGKAKGVLRIIVDSPVGLKTFNDVEGEPFGINIEHALKTHHVQDPTKVWELCTAAVPKEHRGGRNPVSMSLYRAAYIYAKENGAKQYVSMIDDKVLHGIRDVMGVPFVSLDGSEPQEYLGSDKTHALIVGVDDFQEKMSAFRDQSPLAKRALKEAFGTIVDGTEDGTFVLDGPHYKN